MSADSPVAILFDENGNPIGVSTVGPSQALKVDVVQSVGGSGGTNSSFNTTFPAAGTAAGFNDGTNMQGAAVFDIDSGIGVQYVLGVNLRASGSGGSIELGTSSNPIKIDPTGTTIQPISGTITANIGITNGLALDSSVNGLLLSQGSTTSGEKGSLIQGAVTTSAPTYITGQTNPLSLTTTGLLRVDGSGVTQPISGSVSISGVITVNQGTNPWTDDITDRAGRLLGIIYGSQGQQLKQTATNFNTQIEIAVGATLIDPRQIRSLTSADVVTVDQGTANSVVNGWPVKITDGVDTVGISTVGSDKALKVDIIQSVGGSGGTSSSFGVSFPASGTASGFNDGTNMQGARVFDTDSGVGTEYVVGVNLRGTNSGGSFELGTASHPIRIDTTGTTTQPVSGTITANIGTTGGLALDTTVSGLQVSQSSITSGQKGDLILAAVTTSAPSYTNAQTNPLSLTTSGLLRVDGSGVIQPISGTVTANAGSGTFTIGGTVTSNQGTPAAVSNGWPVEITDGIDTVGISTVGGSKALKVDVIQSVGGSGGTSSSFGTSFPASGTASGFSDGTNMQGARVFDVDSGGGTEYVIGINLRGSNSGGSFELGTTSHPVRIDPVGTTAQPVNGTVTSNIGTTGGLALDSSVNGLLLAQGSTTSGQIGSLIQGAVTTIAPSYTTAQTSPLSLTTSGLLRVDGSGVTQPVSGTVTANAGSGTFTVSGTITSNIGTTGGLALDSTLSKLTITQGTALGSNAQTLIGGSVTTTAPSYITGNINPLSLTTSGLLRVDGSGTIQPISGTITVNQGTNPWTDDVIDRAGRLLGVIYGSQGQQLKQTATNFNTQVEIAVGGTLIDPRQIRALTSSDVVTANAGSGIFTIAGTVTSNIGTTGGLALDTTVSGLQVSQGSTTSGQKGDLILGAVTTSAPTYTTAQTNPLSLTTSGLLRVDGSGVTQPISGTITSNQGTPASLSNKWPIEITDGTNAAAVKSASTPPIATDPALVVSISPNNALTGTSANQVQGTSSSGSSPVGNPVLVSGSDGTDVRTLLTDSSGKLEVIVNTVSASASTGLVFGQANTGGATGTLTPLRATTYTEQTSGAQRSLKSTSVNDSSAGTGARQVTITYYTGTMTGPLTETVTLNGTTAVTTTNTNICFIEKMIVTSVGSIGSNQGTVSLFVNTLGTGTVIGSIAVGTIVTAGTVGDNKTLWSHHYVASGKTASISTVSSGTTGNQTGVSFLRFIDPTTATSVDTQITESLVTVASAGSGSIFRIAGVPLKISGPARITQYAVSNGTNTNFFGGFEYSEQ